MARSRALTFLTLVLLVLSLLETTLAAAIQRRANAYAPAPASCPSAPLVRPANGLSSAETNYISKRKAKADVALAAWLKKVNATFATDSLPMVGMTISGGAYRSFLSGAGIIQAFDSRDGNYGTSGLYQALTYQAGLSGGAWLTSSLAGNNWPTVSSLQNTLWGDAFEATVIFPGGFGFQTIASFTAIAGNLAAKELAGFRNTIVDAWGRLLSYQFLKGDNGGIGTTLSSVTKLSTFTSFNAPYPIMTALGVQLSKGECNPRRNATQYEFHPYEFGSWDAGVSAFTQTAYLGSRLSNGSPTKPGACTQNYDNLGHVLGTSSSMFNWVCLDTPMLPDGVLKTLQPIVNALHGQTTRDLYAAYPNPFRNYANSNLVAGDDELTLVDGGESWQINPIWPFLQPSRSVGVLFVNDNSGDTGDLYPDGTGLYATYQAAQAAGLTKMPLVPSPATLTARGGVTRALFFGCDDNDAVTIIYLPNRSYTCNSGQKTDRMAYSKSETKDMIANGVGIGTQGGDAAWPTCLACAIMKKTGTVLPAACTDCFAKYCYKP